MLGWFKRFVTALLTILLVTALGGCSSAGSPLDGTEWTLVSWTLSSLSPEDFAITAQLADGRVSGHGAVNSYGGSYKAGPGDAFSVGRLEVTLLAGPESAMRAEADYLTLLSQARSFRVSDGQLLLYDEVGSETLIFDAVGGIQDGIGGRGRENSGSSDTGSGDTGSGDSGSSGSGGGSH